MDNALNFPNANSYWNVLKDLSSEAKLELIARLSNSLLNKEEDKKTSASSFYGVWKDDEDADCLIEEIRASRKFKNDIEAF
ncbi:hypothetical protein [Bacteroides congonensis]|uniref:hypothetical protein n=1 Tax=Bacteroides congonensis TaxID=1871006 RepID=UPI00189701F0|nr:hypothetical protein [Bacteroides congonensis]